ncbi:MAG: hypothetical protein P8Y12_05125 [Gammaproteobacteria bacterium]|jgi:hypothetical protein
MKTLVRALVYFALVFGAGFLLGPIRILWLVPRVGERLAELIETPIMLIVIILAARFIARRFPAARQIHCLYSGLIALGLLLLSEGFLVSFVRGMSVSEYVVSRDPLTGSIYLMMLLVFALMPWWISRPKRQH